MLLFVPVVAAANTGLWFLMKGHEAHCFSMFNTFQYVSQIEDSCISCSVQARIPLVFVFFHGQNRGLGLVLANYLENLPLMAM